MRAHRIGAFLALLVMTLGCGGATPGAARMEPVINKLTREIVTRGSDVRIDLIAQGRGPLIVLLPSAARDSEDQGDVAAGIAAAGFRVLRPQPRGALGSVGPMEGVTLHDFANDVAAVIQHENAGPAVIVGHALGNWIARMTAVDHPRLVRGIVLAAAAARSIPRELSDAVAKSGDVTRPDEERLTALRHAFFAPGHDASVWLTGWHAQARAVQRIASSATRQEEWWSAGTAPILDLQAAQDPFRPRETMNQLKDELGERVTVVVIPDASHALFPEQPVAVVDAIVAWVRSLRP